MGILNLDGTPAGLDVLCSMAQAASCFAQGNAYCYLDGNVGFAHVALKPHSELSPTSSPPSSPNGHPGYHITTDARVDNRQELSTALATRGIDLVEPTDSELILAAYTVWGRDCAEHLQGDFAFALWDRPNHRLFCARDPMGTRPFYYHYTPAKCFLWASECKPLLQHPRVTPDLHEGMVAAHLLPCPGQPSWSYFSSIHRLPAGHTLELDGSGLRIECYWDIDPDRTIRYPSEREYEEHFRSLLSQAVSCRLRSIGRAGIMLSGGLDSGSIASVAGDLVRDSRSGERQETSLYAFSWAFDDLTECDERRYSGAIVDAYSLIAEHVPADVHWLFSDHSHNHPIPDDPTLLVCPPVLRATLERARALGVTRMLTGTGANALVGGNWPNYLDLLLQLRWTRLWHDLRQHHQTASSAWPRFLWKYLIHPTIRPRHERLTGRVQQPRHPDWIDRGFAERVDLEGIKRASLPQRPFRERSKLYRYQAVANEAESRICVAENRIHREYGIDHCLPLRDARLFEFIMAIPSDQVWRGGEPKHIVRRAMKGILPDLVRTRQSTGSIQPLRTRGLRERERHRIEAMLKDPLTAQYGFTNTDGLRTAYERYCQGLDGEFPLNHAIELEGWLRRLHARKGD